MKKNPLTPHFRIAAKNRSSGGSFWHPHTRLQGHVFRYRVWSILSCSLTDILDSPFCEADLNTTANNTFHDAGGGVY
jgi:hypothetical protein